MLGSGIRRIFENEGHFAFPRSFSPEVVTSTHSVQINFFFLDVLRWARTSSPGRT